ncbi:MAG TPA: DUF255 domain-containing protein [Opitutaceae bacterium]|nr:DUF255 domain-containing protein [Opitutaceae bacterium]
MNRRRVYAMAAAIAALGLSAAGEPPLVSSRSFYVRAQSGSRVHWHPWDEASLAQARASGKSIYVLVGSEISELTRSTTTEIFTRPETAAWLNENFFCIFVDGDTQPEVAAYAQHFINAARQLRGWPVHLWLTPDLRPYDGANYLPPTEEWGRPGFLKSARAALEAWTADRERAYAMAEEARGMMQAGAPAGAPADAAARLNQAAAAWVAAADAANGGFGGAPKMPEPELVRFLLNRGPEARAAAMASAHAWVRGALRLPVGGYYRRTIDAEWKQPYMQKLMIDQPRMALALREAAAAGDETLRSHADDALRFALMMRYPSGIFSMAADNTDPQPEMHRAAGHAAAVAEGLLIAALVESGDSGLEAEGRKLAALWTDRVKTAGAAGLKHDPVVGEPATAADLLGLALGLRAAGEAGVADRLIAAAVDKFFDPATGLFMASPATLPTGITVRAPALPEPYSVEALAVLAGAKGEVAEKLRRSLLAQIEYDDRPPGAVLLALAAGE